MSDEDDLEMSERQRRVLERADGGENRSRGAVTVEVELTEPLVEMIQRVSDDDVTLSEWIAEAADRRLTMFTGAEYPATVDVPEEAVEFAELRAEHARLKGKDPDDVRVVDYICEHTDLRFEYPEDDE